MSATYFCWFCDASVGADAMTDTHYESGRVVFFCTPRHWTEYQDLKVLRQGGDMNYPDTSRSYFTQLKGAVGKHHSLAPCQDCGIWHCPECGCKQSGPMTPISSR